MDELTKILCSKLTKMDNNSAERWKNCVLNASLSDPINERYCFHPVDGNEITSHIRADIEYHGNVPPNMWTLLGTIHEDGDKALLAWCDTYRKPLKKMLMEIQDRERKMKDN